MDHNTHICPHCSRKFTRKYSLSTHIKSKHENFNILFDCFICNLNFKKFSTYINHINLHKSETIKSFSLYKEAFDGLIINYRKYFNQCKYLTDVYNEKQEILKLIQLQLIKYPKYKISFNIICEYILKDSLLNIIREKEIFYLRSSNFIMSKSQSKSQLQKSITDHISEAIAKEDLMMLPGSGRIFHQILALEVIFHKINILL